MEAHNGSEGTLTGRCIIGCQCLLFATSPSVNDNGEIEV